MQSFQKDLRHPLSRSLPFPYMTEPVSYLLSTDLAQLRAIENADFHWLRLKKLPIVGER